MYNNENQFKIGCSCKTLATLATIGKYNIFCLLNLSILIKNLIQNIDKFD